MNPVLEYLLCQNLQYTFLMNERNARLKDWNMDEVIGAAEIDDCGVTYKAWGVTPLYWLEEVKVKCIGDTTFAYLFGW